MISNEEFNLERRKLNIKLNRIIELLEQQNALTACSNLTQNFEQPLHYPLPGDPEPTAPPEFSPMTPDDQAAVERWREGDFDVRLRECEERISNLSFALASFIKSDKKENQDA